MAHKSGDSTEAKSKRSATRQADAAPTTASGQVVTPDSVQVNNGTTVADGAALHGHFVRVVGGEHEGRYGVLLSTSTLDGKGQPDKVVIQTRDDDSMQLEVRYSDLTASEAGHR